MNETRTRICPACGQRYTEPPALSRSDNETEICPTCGMKEALAAMPRRESPAERTRRAVYATGNKWAIENFEASGVRAVAKCQYFQRQDKTTAFNLCCGATSGESISNNMPVANLPVGYQPTQQRFFPAVALNGAERFPGFVVASSNGELSWTGESIPYPGYIVSFGEFLVSENSTVSL